MKPGLLRYRLLCYEPPGNGQSKSGSFSSEYRLWRKDPIFAGRGKTTATTTVEAGEIFDSFRADFDVRTGYPVTTGWRVRELESDILYEVDNVDLNVYKGFKVIKCRKVNE